MTNINITQLTEEQKKALREQLKEEEQKEIQEKVQNKQILKKIRE